MRAGEEFSEMAELGSTYVGGGRWGSSYGGPTWGRTPHHVPRGGAGGYTTHQHAGSYEAEDAAGAPPPRGGGSRSGLYYSPPGTSYTIVERPSSGAHHHTPRADYVREGYSAKMAPRGNIFLIITTLLLLKQYWFRTCRHVFRFKLKLHGRSQYSQ